MEGQSFYVGQRVRYTGVTTYGRVVKDAPGTVVQVSHCVHILLDDSREPYEVYELNLKTGKWDHTCLWVYPQPHRACANIGDLTIGIKQIKPM